MTQYDQVSLGREAKELGFVRDTYEKFCRLTDVLSIIENDAVLSDSLALKGGTAINLTIFDFPRLSVDIDMDFTKNVSREIMLQERDQINNLIHKYMSESGYNLSSKSRQHYALDSFIYEYINAGGAKDTLKIEINYMLRCHLFPVSRKIVNLPWNKKELNILSVCPMEIFSAKTVALINRSAVRDLYDMFNLQKYGIIDKTQEALFKKCIIFYSAIASKTVPDHFDFEGIKKVSMRKIKMDLLPVLRRSERFNLQSAQKQVEDYLRRILLPEGDLSFWTAFANGEYRPELLFDNEEVLARIRQHPMALWKCSKKTHK